MVATYATAVAVVAYVGYQAAELPGRVRTWYQDRALLEQRTRQVLAHVPSNAVLFADGQSGLNHLQAVADYVLYATRTWLPPKPIWTGVDAGQEAREIDTRRPDRIQAFAAGKSLEQLVSARDTVIRTWLRAGRPVYLCLTGRATSAGDWPVAPDSDLELVPVDAGTDAPDTARLGIYQVLLRPDGPDHRHGPP